MECWSKRLPNNLQAWNSTIHMPKDTSLGYTINNYKEEFVMINVLALNHSITSVQWHYQRRVTHMYILCYAYSFGKKKDFKVELSNYIIGCFPEFSLSNIRQVFTAVHLCSVFHLQRLFREPEHGHTRIIYNLFSIHII